jgi:molybdopterin-binding protein
MRFRNALLSSLPVLLARCRRAVLTCLKERHENKRTQSGHGQNYRGEEGRATAHVRLEIAPGQIITASITNGALDDLGLKAGAEAVAVIKASDVMIAID